MNLVVWIVTGLLAVVFAMAGAMKLTKSKAQLVENPAPWDGPRTSNR
jgi:hypothetical protein